MMRVHSHVFLQLSQEAATFIRQEKDRVLRWNLATFTRAGLARS